MRFIMTAGSWIEREWLTSRHGMDERDLERRGHYENVVAIDHTPFVTREGALRMVLVVIDSFSARSQSSCLIAALRFHSLCST